jgi:PhnB protein
MVLVAASPLATLAVVLAVEDVREASSFFQKLGFREKFAIPGPGGDLVHCELVTSTSMLMLGSLDHFHYENDQHTALIRQGQRGLGITLTLAVDDVGVIADLVRRDQLQVLLDPVDEYYGDRVFMFIDPFGYEWKITQTVEVVDEQEVLRRATGGRGPIRDTADSA